MTARRAAIAAAAALLCACAGPRRESRPREEEPAPAAAPEAEPGVEEGFASWYGRRHHGKRTASGERFDMNALTAAHPRLPFGTRLRVTNLETGRSVVVRVNDRGPFTRGRIVDLSAAAARAIGIRSRGVARVRVEPLDAGEPGRG